jgi:hypothetical protein
VRIPRIEFRIPIVPNDPFFSNIRLAALSLRRLGEPYASAKITAHVGDRATLESVIERNSWATAFPLEWKIVPHDQRPYWGTANDRFASASDADVIICSDADTCLVDRIDGLLGWLDTDTPTVAGLQAHYPPWPERGEANDDRWRRVFEFAQVEMPPLEFNYSMDPDLTMGKCPAYFNFGFVAFNRTGFEAVRRRLEHFTLRVAPILPMPVFQCQIGLTLASVDAGLDIIQLSHAFNCANDDNVSKDLLENPSRVRVIHYLRTVEFDRWKFLTDKAAYGEFTGSAKRNPIGELLRQHIIRLGDAFFHGLSG